MARIDPRISQRFCNTHLWQALRYLRAPDHVNDIAVIRSCRIHPECSQHNVCFFIIAAAVRSLGIGELMRLVFAVTGDMFPPVQRSRWVGLLQISIGVAALCCPTLGGWFAVGWGWEYLSRRPFFVRSNRPSIIKLSQPLYRTD